MEEMQQKGEAWTVLHHLYITYKEINSHIHNTKQLSHSYPLSYAHHTAKYSMSQKQQRKGTENLHELLYRNDTNIAWSFNMFKENQSTQYKEYFW